MTCDRRLYFHSEGRRAEGIFALKIPGVFGRVESANLGTKGQHATRKPQKPLDKSLARPWRETSYNDQYSQHYTKVYRL